VHSLKYIFFKKSEVSCMLIIEQLMKTVLIYVKLYEHGFQDTHL